ncbi:MAG: hypothetical protein IT158_22650 [Bryobacterales bacterium]|nr:hypothetical protein [Bryobacterales bacterium]
MASASSWSSKRLAILLWIPGAALAQFPGVLSIGKVPAVPVSRKETVELRVPVVLRGGYHVNSNTPSEDYLIPLRLTWDKGPLEVVDITYPKPTFEKYRFSARPLSVFTGNFEIATRFKAAPGSAPGPAVAVGKLRYQACNESSCLPPRTIEVRAPVQIK